MSVREVPGRPGYYDVRVYMRVQAGERRPRAVDRRVKGLRNAQSLERDLLSQRDEGLVLGSKPTLAAFLDEFLTEHAKVVSAQTAAGYRSIVRSHITPALGKRKLTEITEADVESFYADLLVAGYSDRTRRFAHTVLKMALAWAVRRNLVRKNVCDGVKVPRAQVDPDVEDHARALDEAEAALLLRELQGTTVYAPAALALATGMRRGEVLALKWSEVDLKARSVKVIAAVEQVGNVVTRKGPKTKRSRREIPLSDAATDVLAQHKQEQAALRRKWGPLWQDEGYVFPSVRVTQSKNGGRVWTPNAFSQAWHKALTTASERRLWEHVENGGHVEDFEPWDFGFHVLRHTAATLWLKDGVRLEVVSRRLGHASSAITLGVYSHTIKQEEREGIEAFDRLVQ